MRKTEINSLGALLLLLLCSVSALSPSAFSQHSSSPLPTSVCRATETTADGTMMVDAFSLPTTRRSLLEQLSVSSVLSVAWLASPFVTLPAGASGGATAGGAYLLSAKTRYYDRVKAGVKGFLALGNGDGDLNPDPTALKTFFTSEDVGYWKDYKAAGYLLSNAFRRNSSTPPDSLPAVKKWKAFAGRVEAIPKLMKKKDAAGASKLYKDATTALEDYLEEVELPSGKEILAS